MPEKVSVGSAEARMMSLRIQNMMHILKVSAESSIKKNEDERVPVVCIPTRVDKSNPDTYSRYAEEYHTSFPKRVADLTMLLRPYILEHGIKKIVALNDGAGACQQAVKELNISGGLNVECFSQDPSLQLVEIAKREGREVVCSRPHSHLLRQGVFVVSHSESVDPGLVNSLILLKKDIIVFESSEEFLGKDRLIDNGKGVFSTFKLPTYAPLADCPRPKFVSKLDILLTMGEVYVSDPRVVYSFGHVKDLQGTVKMNTTNPIVYEKALKLGIDVCIGTTGIGVYINTIDKICEKYFNLRWESFHVHFSPVTVHRSTKGPYTIVYCWPRDKTHVITIAGYPYGWGRGYYAYYPQPNKLQVLHAGMNLDFRDVSTLVQSISPSPKVDSRYDYMTMRWTGETFSTTPWVCPSPALQVDYDFVTQTEGYRDGVITQIKKKSSGKVGIPRNKVLNNVYTYSKDSLYVTRSTGPFPVFTSSYLPKILDVIKNYKYRTPVQGIIPKWLSIDYLKILDTYFFVQSFSNNYVLGIGERGTVEISPTGWAHVRKEISYGDDSNSLRKLVESYEYDSYLEYQTDTATVVGPDALDEE